jgi:hypothetical protein
MTVGAMGDSMRELRYVKHSMSRMWTCGAVVNAMSSGHIGTHLINKNDAGDHLGDALVNVPLDNFVHLTAQLVSDLRATTLDEVSHDTHDVLPALRSRIRSIEVAEGHVLYKLLALVDVALW